MAILNSGRLVWHIDDASLDNADVSFDGHPLTPVNLNFFQEQVQLRTPNLILNFYPMRNIHETERVEFPTGNVVTPLQILGAIHTYYSIPMTEDELTELEVKVPPERIHDVWEARRNMPGFLYETPRSWFMGAETLFVGIFEERDGSFTVLLKRHEDVRFL